MSLSRVFVARLNGLSVFDPLGDEVGRVRDVVVTLAGRMATEEPRVIGMVVEVPGRRRVFVPITRVTSVDSGQVITTGLVNMRRFEQRAGETLVVGELLDRQVMVVDGDDRFSAVVEDVAMERQRSGDWRLTKAFVRKGVDGRPPRGSGLLRRRRGETVLVDTEHVHGLQDAGPAQAATALLEAYEDLKPQDLAEAIHDLTPKRRAEVADALDDETLADVMEELPDDDRLEILTHLATERAADILEVMQPDDATDLLADLPEETQEELLQLMQPDEAADIRRLLTYEEDTAGGLMTTEPVILGPEASIAEALAMVRREELHPATASLVYVTRPPHETPTGRLLGSVHIQRLLREPPHQPVGSVLDTGIDPVPPGATLGRITRALAADNLVALPVTDPEGRLLGAVTVDDVLDHLLPDDWREDRHDLTEVHDV
ncbi:magnesium transporter MgtE N-terminal domain-containing protein [Ornithinimicrobium sufpigmenti]|uniref:magnesium transporter MgtE N-terminal domain-containing protein n=1 Tax=Ornithinimicrobium sufpigmenti TaxID=2508882 RepID=UPI001035D22E|nr:MULTISPECIES: CBS domain-containing protein [unclassified Ornithinimicrobium]